MEDLRNDVHDLQRQVYNRSPPSQGNFTLLMLYELSFAGRFDRGFPQSSRGMRGNGRGRGGPDRGGPDRGAGGGFRAGRGTYRNYANDRR